MAGTHRHVESKVWCHLARVLLTAVALSSLGCIPCQAQVTEAHLEPQEKFVLDQVAQGRCVTFSTDGKLEDEDARQEVCKGKDSVAWGKNYRPSLRSEFIEALLRGEFQRTKLSRFVVIDKAVFPGGLSVRNADIPMEVRLLNSHFDGDLDFSTTHFRAPFYLNGSELKEDANFNSMEVAGGFFLDRVTASGTAHFYHLKVRGDVFIRNNARFLGFSKIPQSGEVDVGPCFRRPSKAVEFGEANVDGNILIEDSTFEDSLCLPQSTVKGLNIERTTIKGELNLDHARIERVFNLSLADSHPSVVLTGLTYGDLGSGDVGEKLEEIIRSEANYDAQPYTELENYYRQRGQPELADDVFIGMKRMEREKRLHWAAKGFSWLEDFLVRYGREPARALLYSFLVVVLGTAIFWRADYMALQDSKSARTVYSPFWYSLDLLTPFIDLEAAKVWMPKENWWFGRSYARVHRILGWILVPIGLAALTGIIK